MSILHLKPTSYSGDGKINSLGKLENLALVTLAVYMRKLVTKNSKEIPCPWNLVFVLVRRSQIIQLRKYRQDRKLFN